ncbi:MAG: zf-HC2 domain-containing protein [Caldimonas sp.]
MTAAPPELDCHDAARLISDALDAAVATEDGERLRRHVDLCESCRNVSAQMHFLRRAMRRMGSDAPQ